MDYTDNTDNINDRINNIINDIDNIINDYDDENENNINKESNGLDVELLNVFTLYYQNAFGQPNKSMFDDIDYDKLDSVNRIQELLYDELKKYDEQCDNDELVTISKPGTIKLEKYNEVYCLKIDKEEKAVCPSLLSLLKYVEVKLEWKTTDWTIIKIK